MRFLLSSVTKLRSRTGLNGRAASSGPVTAGLLPTFVLHGASGVFDEVAIFGGIGVIIGALIFLSWRAGRENKRRRRNRPPR